MAASRYIEELDGMLASETITQEQYDTLADLSAAKDAIKDHGQVTRERDEALGRLRNIERQPVREKVFGEELNIDLSKLSVADREKLDSFDWEGDEPDKEKAAEFAAQWKFPTKVPDNTATQTSGAQQIVDFVTSTPSTSTDPIGGAQQEAIAKARNAPSAEAAIEILRNAGVTHVQSPT
jgi:hypothetical protein